MCTLSITSVSGVLTGGVLTSITVQGTATDCTDVRVSISCQGETVFTSVPVGPGGNWTAIFDSSVGFERAECQCQGEIKVEAQCSDVNTGALCTDSFGGPLPCEETTTTTTTTTTEPGCPDPVILGASIGDCNPEDSTGTVTRTVTLSATAVGGSGPNARWDFGDASPLGPVFTLTGGVTHFEMHNYAPGTFTATLVIDGCPDASITITVPECPETCPDVSTWATPDTEDCIGGLMNVALNTFNPGPATITAHWEFGDASPNGPSFTLPSGGGHTEHHNYAAPGTYTATLHIDGCPDETVTFTVPECPPTTTTTTTTTTPTTTTTTTTTATTTTTTTPPGDGGFCGSLLCCILCGIWALLLAGYIIGLATCVLSDPLAVAIASAVLAAAAGFFIALCGVCTWARCTIVGVILGVIGAIIALIFSEGITVGCLIAAGSAALGFLLAALAILWLGDC